LVSLSVALVWWRPWSEPHVNLRPSAAVGQVLAGEVERLLGGAGKVLVLGRQIPHPGPDAMRVRVASFTAALQHHATLKLVGTKWAPRAPAGIMDLGAVTADQLLAALEEYPDANAVVVFAGLPAWSQGLVDKLTARSLKLVAVCGYGPTARRWLESRALALAVVPRLDAPPASPRAPRTAREWFEREFQLVTPDMLATLPY